MSQTPLMPKATALWLIDNTTLTFEQIADFCDLHVLEIQSMADAESATSMVGSDPIANNQLSKEEITRCEANNKARLQLNKTVGTTKRKGARYIPVKQRQDRPNAIAWILKHHPKVTDAQICRLIGTTKSTIEAIRNKTHRNASTIKPQDPVLLGLCLQKDLNAIISKAEKASA